MNSKWLVSRCDSSAVYRRRRTNALLRTAHPTTSHSVRCPHTHTHTRTSHTHMTHTRTRTFCYLTAASASLAFQASLDGQALQEVVGEGMLFKEDQFLTSANLCRWVIDFKEVQIGDQVKRLQSCTRK
jgi:hypothetical protein